MADKYTHNSVLCHLVISHLSKHPASMVVDATFGRGGHSRAILSVLPADGRLWAFDRDPFAAESASLIDDGRFVFIHSRFSQLRQQLLALGVNSVSDIVMDLGVSSPQIDDPDRGFSFLRNGPLDMRMDCCGQSASEWISTASILEMSSVFKSYGEERFAKRIAAEIDCERKKNPITTTGQLASLISRVVPFTEKGKHPATRVFQSIRIHINNELEELESALQQSCSLLVRGGRLIVISFHSLEDRIVKQFIRSMSKPNVARNLPLRESDMPSPSMKIIGKFRPDDDEIGGNRRSRSAILRVAEKIWE
ncbi:MULTISPECIES: 16S rRNA (cytosine(1402)-N(4))-methyltransferase RsmH [Candidatus Ichthyocystis]|uniref:Ribosomal RNA small subunit methyltransferase H n=1 Tax=Candidatus Ichthyocystis hellenicum TaxID=1561003 RepID=A0A0S4M112_9BURK|nr:MULTISPECIES: 16S rRNA (cytosine(1402)-N(4))-methyltransferase RsmH [Ichthyocystis]CUT17463.1 Ribosomal RNA small subunit methyltransferase H [Candidatus Ichthyocystis hellenicum]